MANLTAVIGADTSKFVSGIKSAQDMLDKFVKETDSASKSTEQNISVTNEQAAAYQRVVKQLEKVGSGTMSTSQQQKALTDQIKELKVQWQNLSDDAKSSDFGKSMADTMKLATNELNNLKTQLSSIDNIQPTQKLKTQLRQTTEELQNLTVQYKLLTASEKTSPFGVELSQKIDEVRKKAGNLRDVVSDVDAEIKVMASDTPHLDAFNQGISIGADLISTYASLVAKLTGDTDKLKDAIATIATVQSAANLTTKIAAQLQSSSILMMKTRKVQEAAAAAAIRIRTAAEGKGTIATKAATVAQTAFNAVAKANPYVLLASAVIAAVSAFVIFTRKTKEDTEEQKKHNEALEKAKKDFDDYASDVGSKGGDLIAKYTLLKETYANLKTEHQKLEWIKNNQKEFNNLGIKVNDLTDAENVFVNNTGAVVEALKKRAIAAAKQAQLTDLSAQLLEAQVRAEAAYNSRQVKAGDKVQGSSHNSATGNEYVDRNGNWVYTAKGAEEANKRIRQETYATVNYIQTSIDDLAKDIAGSIDVSTLFTTSGGSDGGSGGVNKNYKNKIDLLEEEKRKLEEQLPYLERYSDKWQENKLRIAEIVDEIKELKEEEDSWLRRQKNPLGDLSPITPIGLPNQVELPKEYQQGIVLPVKVEVKKKTFKEVFADVKEEIDGLVESYDKLSGGASGIVGSINSVYESFKNLNKELEDAENGWESFFTVFQAGMTVLDGIATMIQSITTIMEVLNTVKQTGTQITQQDTNASIQNTTAKVGEAGANTVAAGTAGAAAAAEAGKSVASIPYVGPILAVAAIASVMAAIIGIIASAKSFAGGGIIQGATSVGDYNIARVNSKEMILNGTEQKRLFNLLDGGSFGSSGNISSGQVEFKIKGTELVGCINNVNKKKSKI